MLLILADLTAFAAPFLGAALTLLVVGALFVATHSVTCGPHEVLVISGRLHRRPDGTQVGYRVIKGGRALRVPYLESVTALSLEPVPIRVRVASGFLRGGDRVDLEFEARVKVSGQSPALERAIERFLGQDHEIAGIAESLLEGSARAALAARTLLDVQSLDAFGLRAALAEVHADCAKLGLEVISLERPRVSLSEAG